MAKFKLQDPTLILSSTNPYTFEIGPNEFEGPTRRKRVSYDFATAPDSTLIVFEGRDEARTKRVSGTILTSAQYETMKVWFNKRYQIYIFDDNGTRYTIYITSFDPKRQRSTRLYPFKYTYTCEAFVTEGTT
jgi:hypothetical protein